MICLRVRRLGVDENPRQSSLSCNPGGMRLYTQAIANPSQSLIHLSIYPPYSTVKFRLGRVASFSSRRNIIHRSFITISLHSFSCLVDNNHSFLFVIFSTVVDYHITFYQLSCLQNKHLLAKDL